MRLSLSAGSHHPGGAVESGLSGDPTTHRSALPAELRHSWALLASQMDPGTAGAQSFLLIKSGF